MTSTEFDPTAAAVAGFNAWMMETDSISPLAGKVDLSGIIAHAATVSDRTPCSDCGDLNLFHICETDAQRAAIAKADRRLRRELEAITDPRLRAECLRAL